MPKTPFRRRARFVVLFGIAGLILAACGSSGAQPSGTPSAHVTTTTVSASNAPMHVTVGTGTIGPADPTTTVPNEGGHNIAPVIAAGQNIIIGKGAKCYPQELEADVSLPVVWYNLSGQPARVIFSKSIDSGTIPAGGTFTWSETFAVVLVYKLEPSGEVCKLQMNQPNP